MDVETVREYCLSKKGAVESMPFDETSLVIKVMGKMFILINLDGQNDIALKCDPKYVIELRDRYYGITPAYHFNKKYWNQIDLNSDVSESKIKELIDHSLAEVIKKFPNKLREEYESL